MSRFFSSLISTCSCYWVFFSLLDLFIGAFVVEKDFCLWDELGEDGEQFLLLFAKLAQLGVPMMLTLVEWVFQILCQRYLLNLIWIIFFWFLGNELLVLSTGEGAKHVLWQLFCVICHEVFVQNESIVTLVGFLKLQKEMAFLFAFGKLVISENLVEVGRPFLVGDFFVIRWAHPVVKAHFFTNGAFLYFFHDLVLQRKF